MTWLSILSQGDDVDLVPTGSKGLRDAQTGVKVEFLVTGQFPGDGKPKPVRFPDPESVAVSKDGIKYLRLDSLVELKLASGMTSPDRLRDLADVQELIRILNLPKEFSESLSPYVRGKYQELWQSLGGRGKDEGPNR